MRVLIAILSCHSYRAYEQAERDTWIKDIPAGVNYKFFLGLPSVEVEPDEVVLDVGDGWLDITKKSVAVFRWALQNGYDYVYKCDLDTLVRPKLLLSSGFENYDYTGGRNRDFASGGAGYWLSRKAMQIVISCPIMYGPEEDVHTSHALREQGISLHPDARYMYYPGDVMDDRTISYHLTSVRTFGNVKYDPQWMYETWEAQKLGEYKSYCTERIVARPPEEELNKRTLRFRRLKV